MILTDVVNAICLIVESKHMPDDISAMPTLLTADNDLMEANIERKHEMIRLQDIRYDVQTKRLS